MPVSASGREECRLNRGRGPGARLGLIALVLLPLASIGCGYSIRAPYDKSVKTVFVQFKTRSFRRDVNTNLIEMVQKEIMHRTPYKVVGRPDQADTILEGTINFAEKNIIVE